MKSRFVPFMHVSRHREIVRQFTPNWFAMTMGTGIVFLILLALPFQWRCCFASLTSSASGFGTG